MTLLLAEVDQAINADPSHEVKQPNEYADNENARHDDQGVFQHLLRSVPYNLLQLAAKLAEVSCNGTEGSFEPVLLLDFCHVAASLLRLVMNGVLSAESAVLLHFETVGIVLLVLHCVVVSLLALGASQSDFNAHKRHLLKIASLYHFGY